MGSEKIQGYSKKGANLIMHRTYNNISDACTSNADKTSAHAKLLSTTIQMLGSTCLHNISVRAISKKSGINSAMISYYFGSKELLYKAVLQEQCSVFKVATDTLFSTEGDIAANLADAFTAMASFYATNPYWLNIYLREIANPTQWYEQIVRPCMDEVTGKAIGMFKAGITQGVFRPDIQPVHVVQALFGIIQLRSIQSSVPNGPLSCQKTDTAEYLSFSQQMLMQYVLMTHKQGSSE